MTVINLGNLKFTWKGDWAQSTAYNKDDIVKYGPSVFVCVDAHTSASDFATNASKFEVMAEGLEAAGTWNDATLYKKGQTVVYGGAVYVALQENTNANPETQTSDWLKFVDGQQFEGSYNAGAEYQKGDIVQFGGYTYIAKNNTTGNAPDDGVNWDIHTRGFEYQNDWDVGDTYNPGDVVKYGGQLYINVQTATGPIPTNPTYYTLLLPGQKWAGEWNNSTDYKIGDVVRYSARSYICILGHNSASYFPYNATYWELLNDGLKYIGAWNNSYTYQQGDVVEYALSSYVSTADANLNNTPTGGAPNWALLSQGDSNAVITTRGDILTRDATQAVRLPIGPSGSFLTSDGQDLKWGHLTPQNDYFVSPQGDDSNDGRTPTTSWKTIRHACEQTFNIGQCRINVSSGTYAEQCPIRVGRSVVLEGNGLGAVTLSPDTTNDNGFGVGISDDGSTPNANSEVFHMNNGCRMRNFVFRNFSTGSVIVSLDPGTGPDDTSVWITSQSPYVQNCTSFTPGGTGFKIDGGLHNGGYKSMVANDWTQINSDGVGIHVLNDGRTEIVSCFTYYCNIGYLAESGGKIRGIVGNNSYGEYGAVARGFSQSETPLTGTLELNDETLNSVETLASNVHVFTSFRDTVGNRVFVGHTAPTGTDVTSTFDPAASYPYIAKYNSAGSLDWQYTYEGSFGAIHSVIEAGQRYFAGGVFRDGATNKGFVLCISKAGEIQWQKTVGNTSEIADLATDGDFVYAVGVHTTSGMNATKFNVAGVEQWSRTFNYNDSTATNTIVPTSCTFAGDPTTSVDTYTLAGDSTALNNLYIAAYDSTVNESTITRITDAGVFVNTYTYGDVAINSLRLDTGNGDGIYLLAGGSYDNSGTTNPLLFRLSVDGVVQWQKQFALGSEAGAWKDVLPFGNDIYVAGYQNEGTNNNNAGLLARYSSNGTLDWAYKFDNGTNNIAFNGVMLDGVNVIAAGIEQGNSVIVNVQRDADAGIGTVTSGSYAFTITSQTETANTVVTKAINAIDQTSVTLGTSDTSLTLNQSPSITRSIVATRAGFGGIGTGVLFSIDNLSRSPKNGSVLQIAGDTETYFVIGVNNFDEGAGTASIQINPAIPSNKTPGDGTAVTFREAFSQVRMSGHDFLDIGTGGFADTNYPVIISSDYTQQPDQNRETLAENGGRVFYVTTDQSGNFRVGDYFKIEQATGRATLSSEEFDLAGLNELQLGSITAGKQGATINEFSTDGTFADNSDQAVPTEKAVKTYVDLEISNAVADANAIVAGNSPTQTKVIANTSSINVEIQGTEVTQISSTALQMKPGGSLSFEATSDYMLVPKGDTASRPGSPVSGYLRYNTDTETFEGYNGTQWSGIGGGNPWIEKGFADNGFTAANNDRIFVNTSGGQVTINLPNSPAVGDNVRFMDLKRNFSTNNLNINRNGNLIMGLAENMTSDVDGSAFQLVYSGATDGWLLLEV
jgi:hypothetical protein